MKDYKKEFEKEYLILDEEFISLAKGILSDEEFFFLRLSR
jgi:hypothetical protein